MNLQAIAGYEAALNAATDPRRRSALENEIARLRAQNRQLLPALVR